MATERDYERLVEALSDLRRLFLDAERALDAPPSVQSVEHAALLIRKMIEGIALFSFVVNRDLLDLSEKAIRSTDADEARKRLRELNPGFWPKPQVLSRKGPGELVAEGVSSGFLRVEDYGPAIGRTSDWLHWRNPYSPALDVRAGHANLVRLLDEVEVLLRAFIMSLPNDTDLLLCSINCGTKGARDATTPPGVGNLSRQGELP